MNSEVSCVCQFLIVLHRVQPLVWRRIVVPERYDFWGLHVAIQDAMGWADYHLHEFRIINPKSGRMESIGIPDEDAVELSPRRASWDVKIARYFNDANPIAEYEYDFGDGWRHSVILEETLPRREGTLCPLCLAGGGACPPEDCGGPWGYERFLRAIADPADPEHSAYLEWIGGAFDPERFNPASVTFDDPDERWTQAFATAEDDSENLGLNDREHG